MEPELPKGMPMADQPNANTDAPAEQPAVDPANPAQATLKPRELTRQEKAELVRRTNSMNDLTLITQAQLKMMGLTGITAQDVLIFTMYSQVRHLQAMFDALCELLLAANLLCQVPGEPTTENPSGELIGLAPLNRENYFNMGSLKADGQVSMIRRQMLSTGGTIPKAGNKDS